MTTEILVKQVRNIGQSIIDNAESIVGDYKYQTEIHISVDIKMDGSLPEIVAESRFYAEESIEESKDISINRR